VHPTKKRAVDVVAIRLTGPAIAAIDPRPINTMPSKDMVVEIGADVFILGYPFGRGETALPIWKRGSVASEPQLVPASTPYFHIDTASPTGHVRVACHCPNLGDVQSS